MYGHQRQNNYPHRGTPPPTVIFPLNYLKQFSFAVYGTIEVFHILVHHLNYLPFTQVCLYCFTENTLFPLRLFVSAVQLWERPRQARLSISFQMMLTGLMRSVICMVLKTQHGNNQEAPVVYSVLVNVTFKKLAHLNVTLQSSASPANTHSSLL